ncbi:MAG: tetratricopeptide repeat protein [Flavobacteriales bacterium]|nr:tetratricopeptide repeat protein [Flavobacteriales bacterium]
MRTIAALFLLLPFIATAQSPAEAELALAKDLLVQGQHDSALAHADRAVGLDPKLAKAWKLRGDVRQWQKDYVNALADYKQAEDLDPNDPRLYVSRSALRITEGNLKGALRDCEKALALDPKDADAWYNSACAKYMGMDTQGALKDADRAVKLKPEHADALFLRGAANGELFHEEDGLADMEAALKLKPTIPGALMSSAVLLYETKRYEEAIARFTQVIDQDLEGKAEAYYYRGDCHYQLENKELACADWDVSARLGDKDATFIVKNYCNTDADKIPKKPVKKRRTTIQF